MKKRYFKPMEWRPIDRFGFAFLGLMSVATGAVSLLSGETYYWNYWGTLVFAPFAILIGLLLLVACFARWRKGNKPLS